MSSRTKKNKDIGAPNKPRQAKDNQMTGLSVKTQQRGQEVDIN